MFISHFATGLGFYMKQKGSKLTFFILVLGTQLVDVLWGLFTVLDIEGGRSNGNVKHNFFDFPWSHSLLMVIVWSVLYGLATQWYLLRSNPELNNFAILSGSSVFSHWILDFIVHNDDMLIVPISSDRVVPSLYLWEFPMVTFFLEILIVGVFWYYYWSNHGGEEFEASKKPFIALGLMLLLHVVTYLATFADDKAVEVKAADGISVFVLLLLIPAVMTWLHPVSTD